MKKYSSAVEDYFQNIIKNSWTWDRLTLDEQNRFINMNVFDEIKGNDQTRIKWLNTIYSSFLTALGYKPIGWREMEKIQNLQKKVFNDFNRNDQIVIEGDDCYMMVVQINSNGEVDYTVYDGYGSDLDGGIYEADNITYKDLFNFTGFDKFNEQSRLWEGEMKDDYLDGLN